MPIDKAPNDGLWIGLLIVASPFLLIAVIRFWYVVIPIVLSPALLLAFIAGASWRIISICAKAGYRAYGKEWDIADDPKDAPTIQYERNSAC